jgi:transglutaminase-like putative cysteine protease
MNYQVTHRTTYRYSAPVSLGQNLAHLTPREVPWQRCRQSVLTVHPEPAVLSRHVDSFGNHATFFSVQQGHGELTVTAEHQVEVWPREEIDPSDSPAWERVRDQLATDCGPASLEACQFAFSSRFVPSDADLAAYARESFTPDRPLAEAALDLTARIQADFTYDTKATTVLTQAKEVLACRRGVCQDFAHLEIACLRSLGLAARYISGYLASRPPPGQPRLLGVDATHAWVGVHCPRAGWIELDPTNNMVACDRHIVLAWGRDYDDVIPLKGVVLGGGRHSMSASVDVVEAGGEDDPVQGTS